MGFALHLILKDPFKSFLNLFLNNSQFYHLLVRSTEEIGSLSDGADVHVDGEGTVNKLISIN